MSFSSDMRHIHCCNEVYKAAHCLAPNMICRNFSFVSANHTRDTRAASRNDLSLPDVKLDLGCHNFTYRDPNFWNLIDLNVQNKLSLPSLKELSTLQKHFSGRGYGTLMSHIVCCQLVIKPSFVPLYMEL